MIYDKAGTQWKLECIRGYAIWMNKEVLRKKGRQFDVPTCGAQQPSTFTMSIRVKHVSTTYHEIFMQLF
jgi:hypothetical protein